MAEAKMATQTMVKISSLCREAQRRLTKTTCHGDFDGRDGGKWKKAEAVYLTRRADLAHTGQLAFENLNYDFIGTPGA